MKIGRNLLKDIRELRDIIGDVKNVLPSISTLVNNIKQSGSGDDITGAINFTVSSLMNDPYVILGVSRSDPDDLINKIYHVKVKYYHTDNQDTGDVKKFIRIFEAYKRIKDDRRIN